MIFLRLWNVFSNLVIFLQNFIAEFRKSVYSNDLNFTNPPLN